jgi:hypothetical protein
MTELLCNIEETTQIGENEYFMVYCLIEDKKYTIPTNQLLKYGVSIGEKHYFKKEQNINTKQYFLNYVRPLKINQESPNNKNYKIGEQYLFDIISIEESDIRKGEKISIITVEDIDKNKISILGLKWQNNEIWQFDKLRCEVESIQTNGIPRLINKDYRHPIFEVGKEYEFQVLESKTKISQKAIHK